MISTFNEEQFTDCKWWWGQRIVIITTQQKTPGLPKFGEAPEVYPCKNLNIRILNELQTERAAPNIRPVVGKVIRETIFEDQTLILISRTNKDNEERRMKSRKVERQTWPENLWVLRN